jgi:hypothetical protein
MGSNHTVPVAWSLGGGPVVTGSLEVLPDGIRLTGTSAEGDEASCRLDAAELVGVTTATADEDRLKGLAAVVLVDGAGRRLRVAALDGGGVGPDLVELLRSVAAAASAHRRARIAVRVPIAPGRAEEVRALVRGGPPFDPAALPGLESHDVFVREAEVLFVFAGDDAAAAVERLLHDARVWSAAERWNACVAGPPSIVAAEYSWARPGAGAG